MRKVFAKKCNKNRLKKREKIKSVFIGNHTLKLGSQQFFLVITASKQTWFFPHGLAWLGEFFPQNVAQEHGHVAQIRGFISQVLVNSAQECELHLLYTEGKSVKRA